MTRFPLTVHPAPLRMLAGAALLLVLATATPASADGILAGFIGTAFGGSVSEFEDLAGSDRSRPLVYGGVLGGVKRGAGLGFEVDFGYSPDFFDTGDETGVETSITTVMGNLVIGGATDRGVAPYVSGGLGLIRANVEAATEIVDNLTANDFGFNVGGGLNVMFGSNVGVRADLRYFRSFESEDEDDDQLDLGLDLSDFTFWRGAVGLVVRW